jgi:hypothetical protein
VITAIAAMATAYALLNAGAYAWKFLESLDEAMGWLSLIYLAFGAFGIYALIVGK